MRAEASEPERNLDPRGGKLIPSWGSVLCWGWPPCEAGDEGERSRVRLTLTGPPDSGQLDQLPGPLNPLATVPRRRVRARRGGLAEYRSLCWPSAASLRPVPRRGASHACRPYAGAVSALAAIVSSPSGAHRW
jgi:hypothetical protein